MAPLAGAVAEAVESCPDGVEIALVAAGDEVIELGGPAPCTAGTRAALAQRAKGIAFRGGCDNVPALLRAWDLAAGRPAGAIVWLHATQPVQMTESEALLQKWERRPGNPTLYDFQFGRGPNKVAEALNGLPAVRRAPCFGDPADDVRRLFGRWSGKRAGFSFERRREQAGETPAEGKGSSHIVRLWAHDEILRLGASRDEGDVKEAVNMALAYRLVTPVSGAVVLETAKQYEDAGLTPAAPGSVPHVVPEPSTWALALLGFAAIRAARRRRHSREAAAGR
jgi:MYXO-CTERM domain-containing protein